MFIINNSTIRGHLFIIIRYLLINTLVAMTSKTSYSLCIVGYNF